MHGWVKKFTSAFLLQIAGEKTFDYLLITYIFTSDNFCHASVFLCDNEVKFDMWIQAEKFIQYTLSQSCMKTEQFLLLWKAVLIHSWIKELDHKAEENLPAALIQLSLQLFFEWLKTLCHVQVHLHQEETLRPSSSLEMKLKLTKKFSLNFLWLLPNLSFFIGHCAG